MADRVLLLCIRVCAAASIWPCGKKEEGTGTLFLPVPVRNLHATQRDTIRVSVLLRSAPLCGCRCEGDTLKDSLEYALEKFEDLSLYRDAIDALSDAEWDTLKVNQSEWLFVVFADAARLAGLCARHFVNLQVRPVSSS